MSGQACPLPSTPGQAEEVLIREMLSARRIAVVGLSNDPGRASYHVGQYLVDNGYDVVPVNPAHPEVLGMPSIPSLSALRSPPDMVLVFRRPEFCGEVARQAVAAGARGLWLQTGIRSDDARQVAQQAGLAFIQDRCMMVEHSRRRT